MVEGLTRSPEPFFLAAGPVGCLLIHGFTNSAYEMRPLGEYLWQRGTTVSGVLLAGHGTRPEDLARTTWRDWIDSAEEGLRRLQASCQHVFVAGQSGGGVVTLYLAMHHALTGVVAMSTPVFIKNRWLVFLPILRRIRPWYVPTDCDLTDASAREEYYLPPVTYQRKHLAAVAQLVAMQAEVRRGLGRIRVPALLLYGRRDKTIDLANGPYIFNRIASERKRLVWLDNSGHGLAVDTEKEQVWSSVYAFIEEIAGRGAGKDGLAPHS